MDGIKYFKVGATGTPDGDQHISVLLVGDEWTLETRMTPLVAFRLAQELIRAAKRIGLPNGIVHQEIP